MTGTTTGKDFLANYLTSYGYRNRDRDMYDRDRYRSGSWDRDRDRDYRGRSYDRDLDYRGSRYAGYDDPYYRDSRGNVSLNS